MTLDALLPSLVPAVGILIIWLATQASSKSKADRRELHHLRRVDLMQRRWIRRLETGYADLDLDLPQKPAGYDGLVHQGDAHDE